nr:MAG TPA: hypothetical protein [Caudoviricetes sp.]
MTFSHLKPSALGLNIDSQPQLNHLQSPFCGPATV